MTSSCTVLTTHGSAAENRDVSTDSEQVLMSTVAQPDYEKFILISTRASLNEMLVDQRPTA